MVLSMFKSAQSLSGLGWHGLFKSEGNVVKKADLCFSEEETWGLSILRSRLERLKNER